LSLKREVTSTGGIAQEYLAVLRDGLEELDTGTETDEERHALLEMKRGRAFALVEKILIGKDGRLDVRSLLLGSPDLPGL